MSKDLTWFYMFRENRKAIEKMSPELVKKVLLLLYDYLDTGEIPELEGEEYFAFCVFKKGVELAKQHFYSRSEGGKKGMQNRWHPEVLEKPEEKPKAPVRNATNYKLVVDMFHEVCTSFPKVTTLSDRRKASIKRLMANHKEEEIKEAFTIAENTPFLKGENNRGWKANFDWLINETNFIKVIEHNYDHNKNGDDIDVDRTGYGGDSEWISNF